MSIVQETHIGKHQQGRRSKQQQHDMQTKQVNNHIAIQTKTSNTGASCIGTGKSHDPEKKGELSSRKCKTIQGSRESTV
jgi:hypothetical protein